MFCLSGVMPRKVKSMGRPLSAEVVCFASVDLSTFGFSAWFAAIAGALFDSVCCLAEQPASSKAGITNNNPLIFFLLFKVRRTLGNHKRPLRYVKWLAGCCLGYYETVFV